MVEKEKSIFEDEKLSYINEHRKNDDSNPLPPKNDNNKLKRKKESKTDPDSGWLHNGEKEHQFAYNAHTVCDKNGYVLNTQVLPSNVHDTQGFVKPYREVTKKYKDKIKTVALDAGYISGPLIKEIYGKRKETIERVFRDAKDRHEMIYTNYHGKKKVSDHVSLIFACINMKKMANFLDKLVLKTIDICCLITKKKKTIIKTIKKDENFKIMIRLF